MKFTLPFPPSVNNYLRTTRQGRVYLTEEAKAYKQGAMMRALTQGVRPFLEGDVSISLAFFRPRRTGDIDNGLKVLFDALNRVAWKDDRQVGELYAIRFEDPANPRVEISVEPMRPLSAEDEHLTPVDRPKRLWWPGRDE